jgi:hypothetical protein
MGDFLSEGALQTCGSQELFRLQNELMARAHRALSLPKGHRKLRLPIER